MMKTILIFSAEPGGAEMLGPVARLLSDTGKYNVRVAGYGHGLDRFAANGIGCEEIHRIRKGSAAIIERFRPDLIVTSATGNPFVDMSEKFLWETSRKNGIPTIAFLDQWQNYAIRFSGPAARERLAYLPDVINCIDDFALQEMKDEGFPKNILLPLGHPYLSGLPEAMGRLNHERLRKTFGLTNGHSIDLFISEPILEYYGRSRGYDQYEVLRFFLGSADVGHRPILIKLHPKDDHGKYLGLHRRFRHLDLLFVRNEFTPLECISLSDRVYGMTSIMLIEAYILGKQVLSLQPGLAVDDPLVLSRRGLVNTVLSKDSASLLDKLKRKNGNESLSFAFKTDKFLSLVRQELKRTRR